MIGIIQIEGVNYKYVNFIIGIWKACILNGNI